MNREKEEPLWKSCLYLGIVVVGCMAGLAGIMIWGY